ncbi:MAG TPA: hypothetical protein VFT50_01145 [Baekduia sp.]|nr:hypothetical protein [Baekduia sp.]
MRLRTLLAVSVALGALSLLVAGHGIAVVAYDPTVWLIWGREILHLDLVTVGGPTWKPLPVLFTTPFSLFGHGAAPSLWLVVGRAGGILGLLLAYRVAARIAGPVAGALSALALALEHDDLTNAARGESEALMLALGLLAVDQHLAGRRRAAFAAAVGVSLLRPESWPLVALYALYLLHQARGTPELRRTLLLVGGAGVLVAALWFVPEKLSSGSFLRGAQRATIPVPGSPAQADIPFLAVFSNSAKALPWPVYVGAVAGAALALAALVRRRVITAPLMIGAAATVYMLVVAAFAQIGFTGNVRYVIPAAGLLAVLSGIGWVQGAHAVAARWGRRPAGIAVAVAVAAAVLSVAAGIGHLADQVRNTRDAVRLNRALEPVLRDAGGAGPILRCGSVVTGPFQTPIVAWELGVHQRRVGLDPTAPGTIVAPATSRLARDARFPLVTENGRWVVRSTCPLAPAAGADNG